LNLSVEVIGIIGMATLIILIMLRMYIGAAMALVAFAGIMVITNPVVAKSVLGSAPFGNLNSYVLTVIPMFTLMGMIISETRLGADLYKAANSWLGHLKGGLASATVVACGFLGAVTGGHYVATVVMSKIALPEMRRYKYNDQLSCGTIAAAAPLAVIIPPSLPFIMYGIMTELSIGKLFISGIMPGILQIIIYIIIITAICTINPEMGGRGERLPFRQRLNDTKGILAVGILFILVIGSIYTGVCTTTESGALGSVGAFIIAFFQKDMSLKKMYNCFKETALTTGMIFLLLAGTYVFISFIAYSKIPFAFTKFVTSLNVPVGVILIALAIMYFILGMFMPDIPMLLLTVPLVYPAMTALGVDGIWLGYFIVKLMALGAITPPIGIVVFILGGCSGVPIAKIFKGCVPFMLGDVAILIICSVFPDIVLFLPSLMGG
jgi:tripartite ATP-independent transporter DctM subunit